MKLIIFLGNPGLQYRKTRHNIGFMAGDFYAKKTGAKFKKSPKFNAEIAWVGKNLLAKPQQFYNLSGESVKKLVGFYKLSPTDILAICDDFNLPFGTIRQREKGSSGGNNGLKSIITALGTDNFARIRVGTGNDSRAQIGDIDFVLSKFSRTEQAELPEIFSQVISRIDEFAD